MGNIIKRQSRVTIINNTCPICLDLITNNLTLLCGHSYDIKCIQEYLINNYTNISCPYCRTDIDNNDMKRIFKKFYFYDYKLNDYSQDNVVLLTSMLKIKRFSILENNNIKIYIPHYKNNTRPIFIKIPRVYRLSVVPYNIDNVINNKDCPEYKYKMAAYIGKTRWKSFLYENFMLINELNTSLMNNIYEANDKINLYINNPQDIITINSLNGTIEDGVKLYSNICEIIIKMYLINTKTNTYLINELCAINYYE